MTRLRPRLRPPPTPPAAASADAATNSFNAKITRLSSERLHNDVLLTFSSMLKSNIAADAHTYPSLFKACTSLNILSLGRSLHQRVIVSGYSSDSYISSSLITFYAKFCDVKSARHVFDKMPGRNVIPWTAMIGCYSNLGHFDAAFSTFNSMRWEGVCPSSVTLLTLLSGFNGLVQLESIHAIALQCGLDSDVNLANSMLYHYGVCGRTRAARDLFDGMPQRDVVSWNSLVSAYAQGGDFRECLMVLKKIRVEGIKPNQQTFGTLLMSMNKFTSSFDLRTVHGQIIADGIMVDPPLATSLLGLYLRSWDFNSAFRVFEGVAKKDVILWTAMISGLVQSDCVHKALVIFNEMLLSGLIPSTATAATVLAACAEESRLSFGTAVHGFFLRRGIEFDIPVQNALITMYAKGGCLGKSLCVFNSMLEKDTVSWNAIISGYCHIGDLCKALFLFDEMRVNFQNPDSITIITLLQACSSLGALQLGKGLHCLVVKSFLQPCTLVDTSLMDMYSKCGELDNAQSCFNWMPERDIVSWTTLIAGYGSHGKGQIALELFSCFLETGKQPNDVIFLSALFACSHSGFVSEGLRLFKCMVEDFRIKPRLEHHACVVDLLCRAGKLEDAYSFCKGVISEPTADVLGIILDACRAKGNTELVEMVARDIVSFNPVNAENYVQLAQIYASMNRWDGVVDSWSTMKSLGLKKLPGWSYIEQNGNITTFFMDHSSHPQYAEMTWVLNVIGLDMAALGHSPEDESMLDISCVV